jgi:hypothetical protein
MAVDTAGPRAAAAPQDRSGAATPGTSSGTTAGELCSRCSQELSVIRINVDGNTLLMESCDGCDARRWQLAGERIDLEEALNQVGEHAGRRAKP